MQYYRCKCGNAQAWTSMGVPRCSRCSLCGSDLAQDSKNHAEPAPHEFVTRFDQDTGTPYRVCSRCWSREDELVEGDGGDSTEKVK